MSCAAATRTMTRMASRERRSIRGILHGLNMPPPGLLVYDCSHAFTLSDDAVSLPVIGAGRAAEERRWRRRPSATAEPEDPSARPGAAGDAGIHPVVGGE